MNAFLKSDLKVNCIEKGHVYETRDGVKSCVICGCPFSRATPGITLQEYLRDLATGPAETGSLTA